MESLSDDQRRQLKRKIETLRTLEQEVEQLRAEKLSGATRHLGIHKIASVNALSVFGESSDWDPLSPRLLSEKLGPPPSNVSWDTLKKSAGEEDKYQNKKNWSSTKGRGNKKAPTVRRLDAEALKKFGVYPTQQFPALTTCDSCGKHVNGHFLKEHQEHFCYISINKQSTLLSSGAVNNITNRGQDSGRQQLLQLHQKMTAQQTNNKRQASEALSEGSTAQQTKKAKMLDKKEKTRLAREKREQEKKEKKEQMRLERERKKKEREKKKEQDQAKAKQPLDLDKQCGVVSETGASPCTRSLTCKSHSVAMKRGVRGRSKLFDVLVQTHLAKSRSAAAAKNAANKAAKNSNAAAVRNATAIALGGEAGTLDESFFEESDEEHGSDSEAEMVIDGIKCSRGKPMAVRPILMPRRRHHYLRVRDLFYDALKPSMGAEPSQDSAVM